MRLTHLMSQSCVLLSNTPPNLNSANIFLHSALGQTVKFNDCQYFWLYDMHLILSPYTQWAPNAFSLTFSCKLPVMIPIAIWGTNRMIRTCLIVNPYNEWVPIVVSMTFLGMMPNICEYDSMCPIQSPYMIKGSGFLDVMCTWSWNESTTSEFRNS